MTDPTPSQAPAADATLDRRLALGGRGLRSHTARGTIINAGFSVALTTLALLKGVVVAAFLSPSEYGVWGILFISLLTITWLTQVGVSDKYVQQSEQDQESAFQKALTLELGFNAVAGLLFALALPVFVAVYGRPELLAPGLVLALALPLSALQAPTWVFYRRMEFVRQRVIQAVDPIVGLAVTVGLAAAGAGYWSLVVGVVVGAAAGSIAAVIASPYRVALSYERGTARDYVSFGWPLLVASASSLVIAQGSIIAGEGVLGLAGAGAITLAATISQYSNRVDAIVTSTLYPAICAIRERTDLLFETFVKSNRLTLMWGVPFGVGLTLFAGDLVSVLGPEWREAKVLLEVFGVAAAIGHIAFNWDAFYRARGQTRPIAVWSAVTMLSFLAVPLPLLIVDGLTGFAIGMAVMTAVSLVIRCLYMARLFSGFRVLAYAARGIAPTVPAAAAVLLLRLADASAPATASAAAELALYVAVTAVATLWFERPLLREVLGYLRAAARPQARAA